MKKLPISELHQIFTVNFLTGKLYWKIHPINNRVNIGDEAGYLCTTHGYYNVQYDGIKYKHHQIIYAMYHGEWLEDSLEIDHFDKIKINNSISNLRPVAHQINMTNMKQRIDNVSGITGVPWHTATQKWYPRINVDNKRIYLGLYHDKFEAICARKSAENKYGFTND